MLRTERIAVGSCALFLFVLISWGMTGNCPYRPDNDEWFYILPALRMAQTGTFNPLWLSHPASTTIYPILFLTHFLNAVYFHGLLFSNQVTAENVMFDHIFLLCYLPRYMSALALLGCVPLIYAIGKIIFDETTAICACFMFAITPQLVYLGQVVRSDCPALFFSLLAIFAILKWLQTSATKFQIIAAVAIGLAMSSRYNSISLVPLLLAADLKQILLTKEKPQALKTKVLSLVGLLIVLITFAITTPYLFLDFDTFRADMARERGDLSLGRDGFSPIGNAFYYLAHGINNVLDPFAPELAVLGLLIAFFTKKRFASLWLASYAVIIIAGTSFHPCHDDRYMFPTIPIFVLFAAHAFARFASLLYSFLQRAMAPKIASGLQVLIIALSITIFKASAFCQVCKQNESAAFLGSEARFYNWTEKNVPEGTAICAVGGWFSPHPERYKVKNVLDSPSYFEVENHGRYISPDDIARAGFSYFVVNDAWIRSYFDEPKRYANHCKFYRELWAQSTIVKQFAPLKIGTGTLFETRQDCPTITIYKYESKP